MINLKICILDYHHTIFFSESLPFFPPFNYFRKIPKCTKHHLNKMESLSEIPRRVISVLAWHCNFHAKISGKINFWGPFLREREGGRACLQLLSLTSTSQDRSWIGRTSDLSDSLGFGRHGLISVIPQSFIVSMRRLLRFVSSLQ